VAVASFWRPTSAISSTTVPPAAWKWDNGRRTVPEAACRVPRALSGQFVSQRLGKLSGFCVCESHSPHFLLLLFSVVHSPGAGRAWPLPGYWSAKYSSSFALPLHMSRENRMHASLTIHICILSSLCFLICRSWSEYQAPTKCAVQEACPGYTNVPGNGAANFVNTQTCAAGYESTRCATCSAGYYQLNARCYFCGSSVDQSSTIAITVLVGVGVMTLLSLAVSTFSSLKLAQAIQVFSLFQGAATVGVAGAQDSPYFGKELHVAMTYFNFSPSPFPSHTRHTCCCAVSLISHTFLFFVYAFSSVPVNFDIEVIKPGCDGVPTFNYAKKLQFTLLLMTLSALLFTLACMVRLCLRARAVTRTVVAVKDDEMDHELDDLTNDDEDFAAGTAVDHEDGQVEGHPASSARVLPKSKRRASNLWKGLTPHQRRVMERSAHLSMVWLDFKHRLCHALLILLSIFYLRLTTLLFQALLCDRMPDPTAATDSEAIVTQSLYLREDGQTACWTGAHNATAAGAIILLLLYSVGYPLFCFVLLTRAFANESSTGVMGWLRTHFSWLRGSRRPRTFSVARAAAASAQDAGESERPGSPSRGGWLQESSTMKCDEQGPAVVKASTTPALSADEVLYAAKLRRRRESVHHRRNSDAIMMRSCIVGSTSPPATFTCVVIISFC
jgi:hypothetical protein